MSEGSLSPEENRAFLGATSVLAGIAVGAYAVTSGISWVTAILLAVPAIPMWATGTSLAIRSRAALNIWAHGLHTSPSKQQQGTNNFDFIHMSTLMAWPIVLPVQILYYSSVRIAFLLGVK